MKEDYNWVIDMQNFQQNGKQLRNSNTIEETKDKIWKTIGFSTDYHYSSVIIEEPEQNLFPETQRELIYHLFESLKQKNRNHSLLLTTHSPYILYALNNCMMGYTIKETMPKEEQKELLCQNAWINPEFVSVWEIEQGKGTIRSIKNSETGTVSKHYFNKIMNDVMDEYYDMLTYLKVK